MYRLFSVALPLPCESTLYNEEIQHSKSQMTKCLKARSRFHFGALSLMTFFFKGMSPKIWISFQILVISHRPKILGLKTTKLNYFVFEWLTFWLWVRICNLLLIRTESSLIPKISSFSLGEHMWTMQLQLLDLSVHLQVYWYEVVQKG